MYYKNNFSWKHWPIKQVFILYSKQAPIFCLFIRSTVFKFSPLKNVKCSVSGVPRATASWMRSQILQIYSYCTLIILSLQIVAKHFSNIHWCLSPVALNLGSVVVMTMISTHIHYPPARKRFPRETLNIFGIIFHRHTLVERQTFNLNLGQAYSK